jgi:hypothetical protein
MSYLQNYLPIIDRETKKILGLYNLGSTITFDGTETTYSLAAGPVEVEVWVPTPASSLIRKVNPAFMASVWGHTDVFNKAYQGYGEFVPLKDTLPDMWTSSSSGLANLVHDYKGPVIEGLEETFGVGLANLVPINTAAPALSGTVTSGSTLTCSNGTWLNTPTSYTYQWYRNNSAIPGAIANTHVIGVTEINSQLSCVVWANNSHGVSQPKYSNTVTPLS